jgi:hypothetical protein
MFPNFITSKKPLWKMQVLPPSPKFQTLVRKRANDIRIEIVYERGVLPFSVWSA